MRRVLLGAGLAVVWALVGWAQCSEMPYTVGGTTVTLRFCGNLTVSGGTCSQVASNVVQCSVPEGTTGTVNLSAQRTPVGAVTISAAALPTGWSSFTPVSGSGSVNAQYRFTVPAGTAGRRFELKFQATAAGVPGAITLTVILEVLGARGPEEYQPVSGRTDSDGKFTVTIAPNKTVTGKLTVCTVTPLSNLTFTLTPVVTAFDGGGISAFDISVPGYEDLRVTEFSKFDLLIIATYDLKTLCLKPRTPEPPPTCDCCTTTAKLIEELSRQIEGLPVPGIPTNEIAQLEIKGCCLLLQLSELLKRLGRVLYGDEPFVFELDKDVDQIAEDLARGVVPPNLVAEFARRGHPLPPPLAVIPQADGSFEIRHGDPNRPPYVMRISGGKAEVAFGRLPNVFDFPIPAVCNDPKYVPLCLGAQAAPILPAAIKPEIRDIEKGLDDLGSKLDDLGSKLDKVEAKLDEVGAGIGVVVRAIQALQVQNARIEAKLDRLLGLPAAPDSTKITLSVFQGPKAKDEWLNFMAVVEGKPGAVIPGAVARFYWLGVDLGLPSAERGFYYDEVEANADGSFRLEKPGWGIMIPNYVDITQVTDAGESAPTRIWRGLVVMPPRPASSP